MTRFTRNLFLVLAVNSADRGTGHWGTLDLLMLWTMGCPQSWQIIKRIHIILCRAFDNRRTIYTLHNHASRWLFYQVTVKKGNVNI